MKELPLELDMEVTLEDPFSVNAWIEEHKKEINEKGKLKVFDKNYQYGNKYDNDNYYYIGITFSKVIYKVYCPTLPLRQGYRRQ